MSLKSIGAKILTGNRMMFHHMNFLCYIKKNSSSFEI